MEMPEEHECKGPDGTELHLAMSDDTVFVHTPVLVVLCIVCQGSEDLQNNVCDHEQPLSLGVEPSEGPPHLNPGRLVQGCRGLKQVRPLKHPTALASKCSRRGQKQHCTVTKANEDLLSPRELGRCPERAPEKFLARVCV
jgi:hypothetical protein